jgi:hypothetical protein
MKAKSRELEEKKYTRRPGDPLRVFICKVDDPEAQSVLRFLKDRNVYIHKEHYCIDALGGGLVWRAPDAVFRSVPDGTYVFGKDGKIERVI